MVGKLIFIEGFGLCEMSADTQNPEMLVELEQVETLEQYNAYQNKWFDRPPLLRERSIWGFKMFSLNEIKIAYDKTVNIIKNF